MGKTERKIIGLVLVPSLIALILLSGTWFVSRSPHQTPEGSADAGQSEAVEKTGAETGQAGGKSGQTGAESEQKTEQTAETQADSAEAKSSEKADSAESKDAEKAGIPFLISRLIFLFNNLLFQEFKYPSMILSSCIALTKSSFLSDSAWITWPCQVARCLNETWTMNVALLPLWF